MKDFSAIKIFLQKIKYLLVSYQLEVILLQSNYVIICIFFFLLINICSQTQWPYFKNRNEQTGLLKVFYIGTMYIVCIDDGQYYKNMYNIPYIR